MLNDCPTCKWCIGQKNNEELVSGKEIYFCKCICPSVTKVEYHGIDELSGKPYSFMISNRNEVGEYFCEYIPKEESTIRSSIKNNQGLKYCFKCNTPTVKVSTGMFTMYDICPVCKI